MRVLITGVTGYIGSRLCTKLANEGHEVVGTSRDPHRANVRGLARAYRWSGSGELLPKEALVGTEAIVHLMGESIHGRWTEIKKRRMYESRVESTRNLVRAIERSGDSPRVLVSASAHGYYGDRGDERLSETAGPGNDFLARLCIDWEIAARQAEGLGVRVVLSRTARVLGKGASFLQVQLPLYRLCLGGSVGKGDQWWPWVHVDDAVGLIRFALEHENIQGPLNVAAPSDVRQREFAKVLGHAIRRPAIVRVPAPLVRIVLGEFADETLNSTRMVPELATAAGYEFVHTDIDSALWEALSRGQTDATGRNSSP